MPNPWNFAGAVTPVGGDGGVVTLVEEASFCLSDAAGDVPGSGAFGLFFRDMRIISRWELLVNGAHTEPLALHRPDPFSAVVVSRATPSAGRADSTIMVFRSRYVGRGMREDLVVRNFGQEAAYCSIELFVDADFANLFAVKERRAGNEHDHGDTMVEAADDRLLFTYQRGPLHRGVEITPSEASKIAEGLLAFEVVVPARGEWSCCVQASPVIEGRLIAPRYACGQAVEHATPSERLAKWRERTPLVQTDHEWLDQVVGRSLEDLGALRIFDPDYPDRAVIAAGAPWFMTVFGRDSILSAWMALIADPDLALGVLQTLARFQGAETDPRKDEQPGRILHEIRFGEAASLSLGGGSVYYGSVDATPLFVMLLGELRRWGLARELVDELLPHADRALAWIDDYGDLDGDGYVEYRRATDRGLGNQGWKDSFDGIRYASGAIATAPIALCEVQAYVYGAYLARAHFAREVGDSATTERYRVKAATLKERFNRDFWLEDRGWLAIGLDPDKQPIDSLASNMGHCLWAGILTEEHAAVVAERLMSPEMFTGWGVRTLASSMGGYNPISYHCGSVWPHDNALIAAGLSRYGFVDASHRIILGLLDAAANQGGRLPELFSGLDRSDCPTLVGYPTSCSPQAWASAAPLLALRTLLRLEPWVPQGKIWLAPALPEGIRRLRVDRIPLAGAQVTVEVEGDDVQVEGVPPGIELILQARDPATAL